MSTLELEDLRAELARVRRTLEEAKQIIGEIDAHPSVFAAMPWELHLRIAEFQLAHP